MHEKRTAHDLSSPESVQTTADSASGIRVKEERRLTAATLTRTDVSAFVRGVFEFDAAIGANGIHHAYLALLLNTLNHAPAHTFVCVHMESPFDIPAINTNINMTVRETSINYQAPYDNGPQ